MATEYRQLTFLDRQRIEEGLTKGLSFRAIARSIGRDATTVSREVRINRSLKAGKVRKGKCRDRNWCKRVDICQTCTRPGAYCVGCDRVDCIDVCKSYARQTECDVLSRAPWVCNACRKNRYGCNRSNRWVYRAEVADAASSARRSESRQGMDMDQGQAEKVLACIKEGLGRGLSPYELSVAYADMLSCSQSSIYRWVQAGYGGITNLELERKVGFKPRNRTTRRRPTSHSPKRNYENYLKLDEPLRDGALEMDGVEGCKNDVSGILTLYDKASHLQLALPLARKKDCSCVKAALLQVKSVCDPALFSKLFRIVLTDNGTEFEDEDGLGAILGEGVGKERALHLYYCDSRQSQQKGSCEKNHTELRQIIGKGSFVFDELVPADLTVLMSHANSNPRAILCGMSPIEMFVAAYGQAGKDLLDAYGICRIPRDELMLKPDILNIERKRRGEDPLTRLK